MNRGEGDRKWPWLRTPASQALPSRPPARASFSKWKHIQPRPCPRPPGKAPPLQPPPVVAAGRGVFLPPQTHSRGENLRLTVRPAVLSQPQSQRRARSLPLLDTPGSDDNDATLPCPVGPRGDGGKMAAAGSLERSFVELSGAERERPRHFREFTACGVGTERAWGNGSHCFPSGP